MALIVRRERPADHPAVFAVHAAAFGTPAEARLVTALREQARPLLSLVAEQAGRVVGHILFSPVTVDRTDGKLIMGLAPMGVLPDRQRNGIGTALVQTGLDRCRELGACAVVVLGHPHYYPRFGFEPASRFGLRCEYDVPDEVFMALELQSGALGEPLGLARYHPAFDSA